MELQLQNLRKRYTGVAALDGVDLKITSGELVALLGPSGSGKTTLLRVIAGLLPVDEGSVHFGQTDATRLSLRERNVGFVFQHYALFKHMTVAENIAFGLRSRPRRTRLDNATITRRVQELLALIQLPALGGRYPEQLSGGQKQRIALARALAIEPSVLLLDEPFGALDTQVRVELRRWLRKLHQQTGQTTLFVTHDQQEALELADRVVVMRAGKVEQVGTPDEVYREPVSPYVFEFIGRSNQLVGQTSAGAFRAQGVHVPAAAPTEGAARLYVRPHDLALADADGIPAQVQAVHHLAGHITVEAAVAGQPRMLELDMVDHPSARIPHVGEHVRLQVLRSRVFMA